MLNEFLKTYEKAAEFWLKLADPRTYLRGVKPEELREFSFNATAGFLKLWQISIEYSTKIFQAMLRGDPDEILNTQLEYISRVEDVIAEIADNPVYSAYVNAINKAYLSQVLAMQEFSNAVFHSLGLPTRKDIVALAEAYVDLKGDIKRDVRNLRKELKEIKEAVGGGK